MGVEFYIPKVNRLTKRARKNLYRLLKEWGVFKDKYKVGWFIGYFYSKNNPPEKWKGAKPTKKQLRMLYGLIFKGDIEKEKYVKLLNEYIRRQL